MERPILTDENEFPTEDVIFPHIGESAVLWRIMFDYIHTEYPELSEQWRFYKDGKSWLMKVTRKSKTIFWLSIIEDAFRITFYFTDKAEEAINTSAISDTLKEQFKNGKRYNRIRGLTITFSSENDIAYAKVLIAIKLSLK